MHPSFQRSAAAALFAAAATVPAHAATPLGDHVTIGGFGTLGGVATNTNDGQYGRDRQAGGADRNPTLDVDSNIGVQLDGKATDWLSGTVQVLGAKREDLGFRAKIEWAYVLLKPLDGLSIRGGRMATPAFLVSDSRNIGYANYWIRPPNEVYGLNVFQNFDGADIRYRRSIGPVSFTLTGLAGKTAFRPLRTDATGDDMLGLNLLVETDWVALRAGRIKAKVSVPSFQTVDDPYTFTGYGATVDHDKVFFQAEYVQRRSGQQPAATNSDGWYGMAGYRFGSVMPYAVLSRTAPKEESPFHLSATQRTTAVGARWDAFKSADLKVQIDRVDTGGTTGISFTTPLGDAPDPGIRWPTAGSGKVMVFSVALDFTF